MASASPYNQVRDCKEHNDGEGADPQHVPYVVPRHRRARLGSAFRNSIFFDLRYVSSTLASAPRTKAVRQRLFRSSPPEAQMWSVPNLYCGSVTLSRFFS